MKIEELEAELKNDKLNHLYLLYGEETFLIETLVKKIKKAFGDLVKGINFITLDENNIQNIISDIQTPAFGYEKKLIIAKNTNIFKKTKKTSASKENSIDNKIANYIEENIEEIKETTVILFIEDEIEKNKLFDVINKFGIVCEAEKLKPIQIIKRLKAIANAYKVKISDDNLQMLIEYCGLNMQDLINELRKLIEYAGENGTIETKDIEILTTKQVEAIIFDLTDNLGKKDIKNSLKVLDGLIYNKEPVQKILIMLYNHFKNLYILKLAQNYKRDIAESLALPPNRSFLVTKYKKQADYFKLDELINILKELIELDKNSKIGKIDIDVGLKSILCMYCS